MNKEMTSTFIATIVIIGLFAIVTITLMGFVDISNPEIAKLVGVVVGWLTGLVGPIVSSYFKGGSDA